MKILKIYISTLLVLQKINNYTQNQKSQTTYVNRWKVEWFIITMFYHLTLSGLPNVMATIQGVFLKPLRIFRSQNLQINLNFTCINTFYVHIWKIWHTRKMSYVKKITESKPISYFSCLTIKKKNNQRLRTWLVIFEH